MNIEKSTSKINFDAVFESGEDMERKFVDRVVNGSGGIDRRAAFAILSNPSSYYYDQSMDEPTGEALLSYAGSIGKYIKLLESHIEMMSAARARLFVILEHHFPEPEAR